MCCSQEFSEVSRGAGGGRTVSPTGIKPVCLCTALPLCVFPVQSSPPCSHTHWQKWAAPAVTNCTRSMAGQQLPTLPCSHFPFPLHLRCFLEEAAKAAWLWVCFFFYGVLHAYQRCKEPAAWAWGTGVLPHLNNLQHLDFGEGSECHGGSLHHCLPRTWV